MKLGEKYLITTDSWFITPSGESFLSVFGTVHGVVDSTEVLGIRTNAKSTNWYVVIGDLIVAGCQIHYAVRCESFDTKPHQYDLEHDGQLKPVTASFSRIYDADASGLSALSLTP
ncbi:hypothetical protein EU805_01715 [Salipiger sp. IMCC34102]|uniref:hypothetical protein n=1 Tax=Salipiger sp. IMCC34102 TaxID=2510647 RepID=UPI00101BFF57|nr:hypothetical protein [Salipiger sp. IMCC34102]RYH04115.1 hypothetical protein EU805_01715 [Salipiger sp. IMCC34102]